MRELFERKKEELLALQGAKKSKKAPSLICHVLDDFRGLEILSREIDPALNREMVEFASGSVARVSSSVEAASGGAEASSPAASVTPVPFRLSWSLAEYTVELGNYGPLNHFLKLLKQWKDSNVIDSDTYLAVFYHVEGDSSFIEKIALASLENVHMLSEEEQSFLFNILLDVYRKFLVNKSGEEGANKQINKILENWLSQFLKKTPSSEVKTNLTTLLDKYYSGERPPVVQAVFFDPETCRGDSDAHKEALVSAVRNNLFLINPASYETFKSSHAEQLFYFILAKLDKMDGDAYLDYLREVLDANTHLGNFFQIWLEDYLALYEGSSRDRGLAVKDLITALNLAVTAFVDNPDKLKKLVAILAQELTGFHKPKRSHVGVSINLHTLIGKHASPGQLLDYMGLLIKICKPAVATNVLILLCSSYAALNYALRYASSDKDGREVEAARLTPYDQYLSGFIFGNVSHSLGGYGTPILLESYILLLESIFQSIPPAFKESALDNLHRIHKKSVFEDRLKSLASSPGLILRLIKNNFISEDGFVEAQAMSNALAEELIRQARALPFFDAKKLLEDALNPDIALGRFFAMNASAVIPSKPAVVSSGWVSFGMFRAASTASTAGSSVTRSATDLIKAELERLYIANTAASVVSGAGAGGIN